MLQCKLCFLQIANSSGHAHTTGTWLQRDSRSLRMTSGRNDACTCKRASVSTFGLAPSHPGRRAARTVLPSDLQSIVHTMAAATSTKKSDQFSAV